MINSMYRATNATKIEGYAVYATLHVVFFTFSFPFLSTSFAYCDSES